MVKKIARKSKFAGLKNKKRICPCGAKFKYSGRGRPFKRCPKCR